MPHNMNYFSNCPFHLFHWLIMALSHQATGICGSHWRLQGGQVPQDGRIPGHPPPAQEARYSQGWVHYLSCNIVILFILSFSFSTVQFLLTCCNSSIHGWRHDDRPSVRSVSKVGQCRVFYYITHVTLTCSKLKSESVTHRFFKIYWNVCIF